MTRIIDGLPLGPIVVLRIRWRQRRRDRLPRARWIVTLCGLGFVVSVLLLVGVLYEVGHGAGKSPLIGQALASALGEPAIALGAGVVLVLVAGACFQRIWFERLARLPGPISVHELKAPDGLADVDVKRLSTRFRRRLQELRLDAPIAVPGATPAQDFLEMLDADRLDVKNPLAVAARIVRAMVPTHAYEVTPTLLVGPDSASGRRYGVTAQVTRLPREAIPIPEAWGDSWEEAICTAADIVTAAVLPRTRLSNRPPWSGWRRFVMPPLLVHNYELAEDFSANRRYEEALDRTLAALKDDPKSVDLRLHLGFVQEKLGLSLDALGTYAAARTVARKTTSALYNHKSRRNRRASGQIACYRYAVLLSGVNVAHQWRKPHNDVSQRDVQRIRLRERLKPELLEIMNEHGLLGGGSHVVAGPPPWSRTAIFDLLDREENDDHATGFFELRNVFAHLACSMLEPVRIELRRPWSPTTWLSPLAVQLTIEWLGLRHAWLKYKLERPRSEYEELWPPKPDELARRIPGAQKFCTWTERYNAACLFALPLLVDEQPLVGQELLAHDERLMERRDAAVRGELARRAVEELAQGMSQVTSAFVASRSDWMLIEDPDLKGLRNTEAFKQFEAIYFPTARRTPKRPARVHRWEQSHYVNRLLIETAQRWEDAWTRRRAEVGRMAEPRSFFDWYDAESEAWMLVKELASEYRHWLTRYALIERMGEWSVKYEFEPLQVGVSRFERDATQRQRDGVEPLREEIKQNAARLEHVHDEISQICGRVTQLKLFRAELRDRDFWQRRTPKVYLPYMCDAHAAMWQRLREWLEERPYGEQAGGRNAFHDAARRATSLGSTSYGSMRLEELNRRFHVFGNGRAPAPAGNGRATPPAAGNGHTPVPEPEPVPSAEPPAGGLGPNP